MEKVLTVEKVMQSLIVLLQPYGDALGNEKIIVKQVERTYKKNFTSLI